MTVGLLTADGAGLLIEVASGDDAQTLLGRRFSLAETLAGRAVETHQALLLSSSDDDERESHEASVLDAGPQIRTRIFELRGPLDATTGGARHRILQIAADLTSALGFAAQVTFARAGGHDACRAGRGSDPTTGTTLTWKAPIT